MYGPAIVMIGLVVWCVEWLAKKRDAVPPKAGDSPVVVVESKPDPPATG